MAPDVDEKDQFLNLRAISYELDEGEWEFFESRSTTACAPYVITSAVDGAIIAHAEGEAIAEFICVAKNFLPLVRLAGPGPTWLHDEITRLKDENERLRLGLNILRSQIAEDPPPIRERLVSWVRKRLGR